MGESVQGGGATSDGSAAGSAEHGSKEWKSQGSKWKIPRRVWYSLAALVASVLLYSLASFSAHHGTEGFPRGENSVFISHHGAKGVHHRHNPFLGHHHHLHDGSEGWSLGHMLDSHHADLAYCLATFLVALALWLFFIGRPSNHLRVVISPGRSMDHAKEQDLVLLHRAYPLIGLLMIIGFVVVAMVSHDAFSQNPREVAGSLTLFLGTGLAATLVVWAARQFERQLQQGRYESALKMLVEAADEKCPVSKKGKTHTGLVLLNDLPESFLSDKKQDIIGVLHTLSIRPYEDTLESLWGGPLQRVLKNTRLDPFPGGAPHV